LPGRVSEPNKSINLFWKPSSGSLKEIDMKKPVIIGTIALVVALGGLGAVLMQGAVSGGTTTATSEISVADRSRQITIWRDPGCGCCDVYAEYLEANGFDVTRVDDQSFDQRSVEAGVPQQGLGCHLAEIDGYYVSGLVPVDIIDRLLTERPGIEGITLPGMPPNAPGMAPAKTGTLKIYAFGEDGVSVFSDE
jgi:hypothetical protein